MSSHKLVNHIKLELRVPTLPPGTMSAVEEYFAKTKYKRILAPSALSYAKHFVSCGSEPYCLRCGKNPRVREEERYCSACKNGRPVPKDVKEAFNVYMDTIFDCLYEDSDSE